VPCCGTGVFTTTLGGVPDISVAIVILTVVVVDVEIEEVREGTINEPEKVMGKICEANEGLEMVNESRLEVERTGTLKGKKVVVPKMLVPSSGDGLRVIGSVDGREMERDVGGVSSTDVRT